MKFTSKILLALLVLLTGAVLASNIILKKEYDFLKHKHNLTPIEAVSWKFSKLRPANFPTIRLAQLAALVHKSSHLFSKVLDIQSVTDIENLFDVKTGVYWKDHYVFDTPSVSREKSLGLEAIHLLIINTIVPFLFFYGKYKKETQYQDRAFQFLEQLKPENNTITEGWSNLGVELQSAYRTQALIQLKNEYCNAQKCVNCAVGNAILKA